MPSTAFQQWETARATALDEVEQAHRGVGGDARGRRFATERINHAYAVILASHFQGFCRDLHAECVAFLTANVNPPSLRPILQADLVLHLQLNSRNATCSSLGADFNRLGLAFWDEIEQQDARTSRRMELLDELNVWRNAIAHQDFRNVRVSGVLRLETVRGWRRACRGLARSFDTVLQEHLDRLIGVPPW
ncbi:MAG: hypothetical protein DWQ34_03880 [Planctomycetota bacterium]|nr:MAG: hypothetical protein DWQ29_10665 [Planctomycetota bacterium]REJ96385.1 MAG: hypothetical protein DWQ34_03880 [Planctomycetota bacterium]REK29656.1 MAG: hypothetical protein DWQ41_03185 [Planctomycetota bacterium]REK30524.1 MAG: hypothetical protein DWQ45_21850 [Planctomycetota bacterium]